MFILSRTRRSTSGDTSGNIDSSSSSSGSSSSSSNHMDALHDHLKDLLQQAESRCNQTVLQHPTPIDDVYCPAVFDGWNCFNHTRSGDTAFVNCPPLPLFDTTEKAFRECSNNGSWIVNEMTGRPWTNTSSCVKNSAVYASDDMYSHIYLYLAGASLSLVLLIISLAIFFGFTQLRCDRVLIHQNLFVSLVMTAISWIIYYVMVVMNGDVLLQNPEWCQVLHVICQYFTACNFSWMFCESLYLHIIMAYALTTGKKLIKTIIVCGWGVPMLLTVSFAIVRASDEKSSAECWVHEDVRLWIIAGPILLTLLLIIIMLINLVRLLVTKLQQIPDAHQSKKAAKAILILVPLFGLQFLLFPVRPHPGTTLYYVYLHVMAFLMSTQGTFVAVIFCFCNGEVRSLLRRKWNQHRLMRGFVRKNTALTSSTYADPYSAVDSTRDAINPKFKVVTEANTKITDMVELRPLTSPTQDVESSIERDPTLDTC